MDFLTELLPFYKNAEGYIDIRAFSDKKHDKMNDRIWLSTKSLSESEIQSISQWGKHQQQLNRGVFIGYNLRKDTTVGDQSNIASLNALYVDCDFYKVSDCTLDNVAERIIDLAVKGVEASFVVNSGGGIQVVYMIEPCEKEKWLKAQQMLFNHYLSVGADSLIVSDTARMLRLPGFDNLKQDQPRPVLYKSGTKTLHNIESILALDIPTDLPKSSKVILPEKIEAHGSVLYEGRNSLLFKFGCKYRNDGLLRSEIEKMLLMLNETRCTPSLPRSEVLSIVGSIMKYEPAEPITQSSSSLIKVRTLADWENESLKLPEEILRGLYRRSVGETISYPSAGKTTMWMNISMSLACGKPFPPLYDGRISRRVLYIDMENSPEFSVNDMQNMKRANFDEYEQDQINQNLIAFFETFDSDYANGKEIDLASNEHLEILEKLMFSEKIDLLVVDTRARAFKLKSENDNSEVERKINAPMKTLARRTNSAVMLLHHVGKNVNNKEPKLYAGRGASASGGADRLTLCISPALDCFGDPIKNSAILHCAKIKGRPFEDTNYILDFDNRWYDLVPVTPLDENEDLKNVLEVIKIPISKPYIISTLSSSSKLPKELDKILNYAVENNLLIKVGRSTYAPVGEVAV